MFRGGRGGTPNQGRRSGPGDSQVRGDYRGSPSNQSNRGAPHQNNPRDSKPDPKSTPGKTPTKPEERNKERPRSRSPINREEKGEDQVTTVVNGEDDENSDAQPVEKVEKKYTGRPGEKKFNGRCRLFVANLHNTTTEDELRAEFGEFGETGEVYVNKEKGFGFIRLDYRHNAEIAKLTLDKKLLKGRNISVRYATHASAIELHGLDNYSSNEFIGRAMSSFGAVERCIVVCDDRGRSKGYAIVEFEWKKSASKVLDRLKDEMFVLGRLPKPVFAKPFIMQDEEEGVTEESLERLEGYEQERSHQPRFISPNSFEYTWAKRWRDLFIEEQEKKAKLEQEMTDARCKLEFEMEAAGRQQEASRIRDELERRQEELRMLSEEMMRRQESDLQILERSRQREMAARSGNPEPPPENEQEVQMNEMQLGRENAARRHDFMQLAQRAQSVMQNDPFNERDRYGPPDDRFHNGYTTRQQDGPQDLMSGVFNGQRGGPPQGYQHGGQGGGGGHRPPHMGGMDFRGGQGGPQGGPPRDDFPRDSRDLPRGDPARDLPARDLPARDLPARDLPARDLPARDLMRDVPQDKTTTEE